MYSKGGKTEYITNIRISLLSSTYRILSVALLHMLRKLLRIINVNFDTTGQLLITYSALFKYLRKKWKYNEAVHHLFIDFKKAYNSVRREVMYNILIEMVFPRIRKG
jgi:hypothetical protein